MTYTFKLARRLAILRQYAVVTALVLLLACVKDFTAPEAGSTGSLSNPTSLQVIPRSVTIETRQQVQFRGQALTLRGATIPTPVAWVASGGTINADGTFSSSTAGTFKVIGRGRGWKQADTSVVNVVTAPSNLVRIGVTPGSTTLDAGATRTFTATGYLSDGSTAPVGVVWSATGGDVDPSGVYTGGPAGGSYRVIATTTAGTLADTASVTINEPAPALARVVVSPASVSLAAGASKQFKAYGRTSAGDSVAVAVAFKATGGTVTTSALYTAGQTAGTYKVIATSSGLSDTAVVTLAAADPVPVGKVGIPFGPFGAWTDAALKANTDPFTMSLDAVSDANIVTRISVARSMGVRLLLTMTGGARSQYLTGGVFDMVKWKAKQATFNTTAIREAVGAAIADGTIVGNVVMDEPFNTGGPGNEANSWGPAGTMTKARVDSMCAYSKAIFPNLPQGVTHDHDDFEPTKSYRVCDFIVSQYRMAKGDVTAFRDAGLALARRDGHSIAFSLNIMDGGQRDNDNDGLWECPVPLTGGQGSYAPNCRMTAAQVREWGKLLGQAGCALTMWRYDDTFMANPDNAQAFRDVAAMLANAPAKSCKRP